MIHKISHFLVECLNKNIESRLSLREERNERRSNPNPLWDCFGRASRDDKKVVIKEFSIIITQDGAAFL